MDNCLTLKLISRAVFARSKQGYALRIERRVMPAISANGMLTLRPSTLPPTSVGQLDTVIMKLDKAELSINIPISHIAKTKTNIPASVPDKANDQILRKPHLVRMCNTG